MRTGNPGHLKAFDYLGPHRYSLTFCTERRQKLFTTKEVVDLVLEQIARAAAEYQFEITTYCFMPDHLHLLIEGVAEDSDCRRFIKHAKQYSGFYYSKVRKERLWQRYGFERIVRDSEQTFVVARYILANPVRAGLARTIDEYPFLGSFVYTLHELSV